MRRAILSLGLLLTLAGCGSEPFSLAPVSGKVTLNGEPLPDAHLLFQPLGDGTNSLEVGPESIARTGPDGMFQLKTFEPERQGAVVGKHKVCVTLPKEERAGGAPFSAETGTPDGEVVKVKYTIPARYRDGSALTIEVPPEGKADVLIELTTP